MIVQLADSLFKNKIFKGILNIVSHRSILFGKYQSLKISGVTLISGTGSVTTKYSHRCRQSGVVGLSVVHRYQPSN